MAGGMRHLLFAAVVLLLPDLALAAAHAKYVPGVDVHPFADLECAGSWFDDPECSCETIIQGAFIRITENFNRNHDTLLCESCRPDDAHIKPVFDAATGVLELSGPRTITEYTLAIAGVAFLTSASANDAIRDKVVGYNFGHALYRRETGHFYQYQMTHDVRACMNLPTDCGWDGAQRACAVPQNDLLGLVGYLFSPEQPVELELDTIRFDPNRAGTRWIGCSDLGEKENDFKWVVGPGGCPNDYSTDPNARAEMRSGCDLGFPFFFSITNPGRTCSASGCGRAKGKVRKRDAEWLWAADEPDDNPLDDVEEDFCRLLDDMTVSDSPAYFTTGVLDQEFYCEFGGIGNLCMRWANIVGDVMLSPTDIDECVGDTSQPATSGRRSYIEDTPVPVVDPPVDCAAAVFTDGCSCQTTVTRAYVIVTSGYDEMHDHISCERCGKGNNIVIATARSPIGWGDDPEFSVLTMVVRDANGWLISVELALDMLNSVMFTTSSTARAPRTIVWNLGGGWWVPSTQSYYIFIRNDRRTWDDALAECGRRKWDLLGLAGYLATVTTPLESKVVLMRAEEKGWIGGSDIGGGDIWRWVAGPEGCTPYDLDADDHTRTACDVLPLLRCADNVWATKRCSGGTAFATSTAAVPGMFSHFADDQPSQPTAKEHYLMFDAVLPRGPWSSYRSDSTFPNGYMCEWSEGVGSLCMDEASARGVVHLIHGAYVCNAANGCAPRAGVTCDVGQHCEDVDAGPDNWRCVCNGPAVGSALTANATACITTIDECTETCPTCIPPGGCLTWQECVDPDMSLSSLGDWQCACVPPATGAPVTGGNASCIRDECVPLCPTCPPVQPLAVCKPGQTCVDVNTDAVSDSDWVCRCNAPAVGEAVLGDATCMLDECNAALRADGCTSCISEAGCSPRQYCEDLNPSVDSLHDWQCVCEAPARGDALTANATCIHDECGDAVANDTCAAAGQSCKDPDWATFNTWECSCRYPEYGESRALTATACRLDECMRHEEVCMDAGQLCDDRYPTTTEDWICTCVPPATGIPGEQMAARCVQPFPSEVTEEPTPGPTRMVPASPQTPMADGEGSGGEDPQSPSAGGGAPTAETNGTRTNASGPQGNSLGGVTPAASAVDGLSEEQRDAVARMTAVAKGVAIVLGGPTGALGIGKLAVLTNLRCPAAADDTRRQALYGSPLDWELSPSGIGLWGGTGMYLLGAVVINAATVLAFVGLLYALAVGIPLAGGDMSTKHDEGNTSAASMMAASPLSAPGDVAGDRRSRRRTYDSRSRQLRHAALGFLHAPGIAYIPFSFLLVGTTYAAGMLLFSIDVNGAAAASVGGMVLCLYLFCTWLIATEVLQKVKKRATTVHDPRLFLEQHLAAQDLTAGSTEIMEYVGWRRTIYHFVYGEIIWVTRDARYFCEKYGPVFTMLRKDRVWWSLFELAAAYAVSFLGVWQPDTQRSCMLRNVGLCAIFWVFFGVMLWVQPFAAPMNNIFDALAAGAYCLAAVAITAGIAAGNGDGSSAFSASALFIVIAVYVLAAKGVAFLASQVVDLWIDRTAYVRLAYTDCDGTTAAGVELDVDVRGGRGGRLAAPSACGEMTSGGDASVPFLRGPSASASPSGSASAHGEDAPRRSANPLAIVSSHQQMAARIPSPTPVGSASADILSECTTPCNRRSVAGGRAVTPTMADTTDRLVPPTTPVCVLNNLSVLEPPETSVRPHSQASGSDNLLLRATTTAEQQQPPASPNVMGQAGGSCHGPPPPILGLHRGSRTRSDLTSALVEKTRGCRSPPRAPLLGGTPPPGQRRISSRVPAGGKGGQLDLAGSMTTQSNGGGGGTGLLRLSSRGDSFSLSSDGTGAGGNAGNGNSTSQQHSPTAAGGAGVLGERSPRAAARGSGGAGFLQCAGASSPLRSKTHGTTLEALLRAAPAADATGASMQGSSGALASTSAAGNASAHAVEEGSVTSMSPTVGLNTAASTAASCLADSSHAAMSGSLRSPRFPSARIRSKLFSNSASSNIGTAHPSTEDL